MIECTLQEAIKRCRKNGGMIKPKYYHDWITPEELPRWRFNINDFDQPWIYEPPKKSAFQEWFSGPSKSPSKVIVKAIVDSFSAKEGWNAAIDAVLRLNIFSKMGEDSWWFDKKVERLKELKEP